MHAAHRHKKHTPVPQARGEAVKRQKPKAKPSAAAVQKQQLAQYAKWSQAGHAAHKLSRDELARRLQPPPFPIHAVVTWVDNTPEHARQRQAWLRQYELLEKQQQSQQPGGAECAQPQGHEQQPQEHKIPPPAPPHPSVALAFDNDANRWDSSADELLYLYRSLSTYLPWLSHVWVVAADGQYPRWLRTPQELDLLQHHLKMGTSRSIPITVVPHSRMFGPKCQEHLPTFSGRPIESHLDQLPELSEHWIYFNDDTMVNDYMAWSEFFTPEGVFRVLSVKPLKPKLVPLVEQASRPVFDETLSKHAMATVTTARLLRDMVVAEAGGEELKAAQLPALLHQAQPCTKQAYARLWTHPMASPHLFRTSAAKFRGEDDILVFRLAAWYALFTHHAVTHALPNTFLVNINAKTNIPKHVAKPILLQRHSLICVNDAVEANRAQQTKDLKRFLSFAFPRKTWCEI